MLLRETVYFLNRMPLQIRGQGEWITWQFWRNCNQHSVAAVYL